MLIPHILFISEVEPHYHEMHQAKEGGIEERSRKYTKKKHTHNHGPLTISRIRKAIQSTAVDRRP